MDSKSEKKIYDCAIIGAGPGGLVSALYLKRFKRSVILISEGVSRAFWIPRIQNLIAQPGGLTGPQLIKKLHRQVRSLGTEQINGWATVHKKGQIFKVRVGHQALWARHIILATGMIDIQPEISNLDDLRKTGVVGYCPICDGYEHCSSPVGLLVSGIHGLKKLKFIKNFSAELHLILLKSFKIPPIYLKIIKKLKVKVYRRPPIKYEASRAPKGLRIHWVGRSIFVRIAYVALGTRVPRRAFKNLKKLRRTKEGFLITNSRQQTSVPGIYAVGDCVHALSQVSVAVGHAAIAATHIHNSIGFDRSEI